MQKSDFVPHLGGFRDLPLTQCRGARHQNISGKTQDITRIGLRLVLRYQQDD